MRVGSSPFVPHPERPRVLLIGEGVGIAPMIHLAEQLRDRTAAGWRPLVLLGSEIPFPFRARPSQIAVDGIPDGSIACMPLLDEWGIASRLASHADFPGCFDGSVTEMADEWLRRMSPLRYGLPMQSMRLGLDRAAGYMKEATRL